MSDTLPPYASIVMTLVIVANALAVLVILRTFMVNKGNIYDEGPPWIVAASLILLLLCYNKIILPAELAFWGATIAGILALWGAWTDYNHLADHQREQQEARARGKRSAEKM